MTAARLGILYYTIQYNIIYFILAKFEIYASKHSLCSKWGSNVLVDPEDGTNTKFKRKFQLAIKIYTRCAVNYII